MSENIKIDIRIFLRIALFLRKVNTNELTERDRKIYSEIINEVIAKENKIKSQQLYRKIAKAKNDIDKKAALEKYIEHKKAAGL